MWSRFAIALQLSFRPCATARELRDQAAMEAVSTEERLVSGCCACFALQAELTGRRVDLVVTCCRRHARPQAGNATVSDVP